MFVVREMLHTTSTVQSKVRNGFADFYTLFLLVVCPHRRPHSLLAAVVLWWLRIIPFLLVNARRQNLISVIFIKLVIQVVTEEK